MLSHAYQTITHPLGFAAMGVSKKYQLEERAVNRIIEMAWEDRTPFDAIFSQFGVPEKDVIKLMRQEMKASSFRMWRKRVQGRPTKHQQRHPQVGGTFKSSRQKAISLNKIAKRPK